jgi:hypothetical protein
MNTAALTHGATSQSASRAQHPLGFGWKVLITVLALGTVLALVLFSQMGTAMDRIEQLELANARLERLNGDLAGQVQSLPRLQKDLATAKRSLAVETSEKNRLAVLLTRAEAGRKQAVADHEAALRQIAALQKAATSKTPTKRK